MWTTLFLASALLAAPASAAPGPASAPGVAAQAEAPAGTTALSAEDEKEVRAAVAARIAALGNVIIDFDTQRQIHVSRYGPAAKPPGPGDPPVPGPAAADDAHDPWIESTGIIRRAHHLSLLGACTRLDDQLLERTPRVGDPREVAIGDHTYVSSPQRTECLAWADEGEGQWHRAAKGWVRHSERLPPVCLEAALGLRAVESAERRLAAADFAKMTLQAAGPDRVKLIYRDTYTRATWVLDRLHGWAPVAYDEYSRYLGISRVQTTLSDFRRVGAQEWPFAVTANTLWPLENGQMGKLTVETATVKEYRFRDKDNTPGRYHVDWPEGVHVEDHDSDATYVAHEGQLVPPAPPAKP